MKNFCMIVILATLTTPMLAQTNAPKRENPQVFSAADVQHQLTALAAEASAKGNSGSTLSDYGSHALKLSVRTVSGGAEVHGHFDDVMIVTGGEATLVTGGRIIDPQTTNGETKGREIQGGKSQRVAVGDIVNIPAGIPHQLILSKGITFSAIVVKVRE